MAIPITFEELLPHFRIDGTCELFEVAQPEDTPTTVIRTDQDWYIKMDWKTSGPLNYLICGRWQLQVLLEEMGKGEHDVDNSIVFEKFASKPAAYSKEVRFRAGDLPEGVFKLVATIKLLGPNDVPGPVVGFAEGPIVQFYDSIVTVDAETQ